MAIGNQVNYSTSSLNTELAQVAKEMHDAHDHARDFFLRINKLGIAGLQVIGFDAPTSTSYFTLANQMNSVALIWFGTGTQSATFPYDDASAAAR